MATATARTKNTKAKAARKKSATRKDRPCVAAYVEWNYVPRIGRGVIARFDALKGTVLERSPVVVAPTGDFEAKHGKKTVIDNYLLTWEEKGPDIEYAVGLGYLMLYNHSSRPNAEFRYNYPDREIEMVALRNIAAGEEITHNYGGVWFKPRPEKKKKKAVAKKKPATAKKPAKKTKKKKSRA